MPRVSVVIPCFNAEQFVREAIENVLRQTYRDYEIVAADNGSTDHTLEVLRSYGDAVRVVQEPRRGASYARNAGIAASSGEFIAFLDADDFWEPGKLEAQVALMDERPGVGMVTTEYWLAAQNGEQCVRGRHVPAVSGDFPAAVFWGYACHISTVMVRRAVVDGIGGFDTTVSTCEDTDFYLRVGETHSVAACYRPLSTYRRHERAMVQPERSMLQELLVNHDAVMARFCRRNPRFEPYRRKSSARIRVFAGRLLLARDRAGAMHLYREALRTDPTSWRALAGIVASALPLPYRLLGNVRRHLCRAVRR